MPYFDWNATAPLLPEARQAWLDAADRFWANPSSAHRPGVQARLALEEARGYLAAVLGVEDEQVIFTSGATEAINGFLAGIYPSLPGQSEIWISSVEHPAVREAAFKIWGRKRVRQIPVGLDGGLDLDWITDELEDNMPGLIAVMAANNETGILHPWERVLDICREHGIPCFCDAVQWMGKMPAANWDGFAGISIGGHKFGGPKGTGCLVLGKDWHGLKVQAGGSQEMGSRAGTEDIPGILAMVEAFRVRATDSIPDSEARDLFEAELKRIWPGEVSFNGQERDRLWNTSSVCLPVYKSDRWIAQLDRMGFQVSAGSACSTGKAGPSPVLQAMGLGPDEVARTIRISSGWETRLEAWESLRAAIVKIRERLDNEDRTGGTATVIEI